MAVHEYLSVIVSDGTEQGMMPIVCRVYSRSWSSKAAQPGYIIVVADVTEAEHDAIAVLDGIEVLS